MKTFLLLVMCVAAAQPLLARQDQVLPDLAPREVEITGDLSIAFPSLRRQPLIGFNPPPRVPEVPADRRPYTEPYKQPSADLPPSPLTPPEPPNVSSIAQRFPVRGVVDASLGRYLDRRLRADLTLNASPSSLVLLSGEYFGTGGHEPFASDASSSRNLGSGRFFGERSLGQMVLEADVEGAYRSYSVFSATADPSSLSMSAPDRRISGGSVSAGLRSRGQATVQGFLQLRLGTSRAETDVFNPDQRDDPATSRSENYVHATGRFVTGFRNLKIGLEGKGRTTGLDESGFPGSTLRSGQVNAYVAGIGARDFIIKAGASLMAFESEPQIAGTAARSMSWIAPLFRADLPIGPGMQLSLASEPNIDQIDMRSIYEQNPTLMDEPELYPTVASIDAWGGVGFTSEFVTARVRAGWKDFPHYRYVRHTTSANRGYVSGYPELAYDEASMLYGNAELSVILSTGMQAGVSVEYRNGELEASESDIPYLSKGVVSTYALASFLQNRLTFEMSGTWESSRYRDESAATEIPALFKVDLEGAWYLTDSYGVLAGVRNLGAEPEFWDRYPLESAAFYLGARARW